MSYEEMMSDRERIITIQRRYNLEHGMSEEEANKYELEQRRRMEAQGYEYTPEKQPSIGWAIIRLILGLIATGIGIYGILYALHIIH